VYNYKKEYPLDTLRYNTIIENSKLSKSIICNAKTTAIGLGLIRDLKGFYQLTEEGNDLAKYEILGKYDKIYELGKELIVNLKKSPVLYYMHTVMKENQSIGGIELGRLVSEKFRKSWTQRYCKNVGNSGKSILIGFHLNEPLNKNAEFVDNDKTKKTKDKILPRISIKTIQSYVLKYYDTEPILFNSNLMNKSNDTIDSELNNLFYLGLIERYDDKRYKLSKEGLTYKRSIKEKNDRETFQAILLNHEPIKYIISNMNNNKIDDIGYMALGELIRDYNQINYSNNTIIQYGSKLLNWFQYANIIELMNGKYVLNTKFKGTIESGVEESKESDVKKRISKISDFDILFTELNKNYCDIFYSISFINNNEWSLKNLRKTEMLKLFEKLCDIIDEDTIKIIYRDARRWLDEAYETGNKKYVQYSYDLISKIKKINK